MTFKDEAKLDASEVSDMRGRRTGAILAGGGGAGGVLLLILVVVMGGLGGQDTGTLLGELSGLQGQSVDGTGGISHCQTGADANKYDDCRIVGFVDSIQAYWAKALPLTGVAYERSQTIFFTDALNGGCGTATTQAGPFYCPTDRKVYIDLGFFKQLQDQFGAKGGPFAEGYVLAHEYGHHVQDLQGTLDASSRGAGAQGQSVRVELQADCYAGIWANHAAETGYLVPLTSGDIAEALDAAAAVGDDRIQKASTGQVNPESWTHGSSEQRVRWFTAGYDHGSLTQCDTFSGSI
jgi:uncharacterized protein